MTLAELIARTRQSGDFTAFLAAVPYLAFLGVRLELHAGRRLAVMRFDEHLVGDPTIPALHGGTLGALLETVAHLECLAATETTRLPKTITLTVDYLRSGKPRDTFATARVIKAGRRVTTMHAFAFQEDEQRPIAMASVHLKVG